jgi:carboxyl-terminal processing protease
MHEYKYIRVMAMILSGLLLFACKDEDEPVSEEQYVNNWIYDNMSFWYLWNNKLPSNLNRNQPPRDFFKSLLVAEDRFSVIYEDYQEVLNALDGVSKEAGYEYTLYRESQGSTNVVAQILYIKPASPAAETELKRGDLITHINGQQLTVDNYRALTKQTEENHTLTYRPLNVLNSTAGSFGAPQTLSLNAVVLQENPNFYTSIYELDGGRKAGYFMYTFFTPGVGDGLEYNQQMDQIIAVFKAQGVTDLIVDLRYNSGGYANAAVNLASLIGKNIDASKTFYRQEYNNQVVDYFKLTEANRTVKFSAKSENIGNSLTGNLYIITGTSTASASELVINGLRPFMPVTLIGEVTLGKNVGSVPVYKDDDPRNRWLLLPIVTQSFNSNGQSDYSTGFIPDLYLEEGIYLLPIGDQEEPLLSAALARISSTSGRTGIPATRNLFGQRLGNSIQIKRKGSENLMLEKPIE